MTGEICRAPGQDSWVNVDGFTHIPSLPSVWGPSTIHSWHQTGSFFAHKTALWHLTHCCPLFLGLFHADYVAVPVRVSHIKQLFMVMCLCLCGNGFFYIETAFLKNISRILKHYAWFPTPGLQLFLFCWGGDVFTDQFHCLFIYLNIHWAPDVSTLVPGSGDLLVTAGCCHCSESFQSSDASWSSIASDFSASGLLLFHHYFSKSPSWETVWPCSFPVIMPLRSSFHKKASLLSLQGISLPFSKIVFLTCDFCYLIQQKRLISWTCLSCWDSPRWLFHFLAKLAWFLEL